MEIAGPIARVLLRYIGGALVAKAGLSVDVNDPDVVNVSIFVVGAVCSVAAEGWYYLARRFGWST